MIFIVLITVIKMNIIIVNTVRANAFNAAVDMIHNATVKIYIII